MLRQTALLLTLVAALGQPTLAGSASPGEAHTAALSQAAPPPAVHRQPGAASAPVILPQAADDIRAGRGPAPHGKALRQIAIDEAVGNRDGVEMLKARLRAAGVSRDTLRDAGTWTQVHQSRPFPKMMHVARPGAADVDPARTMY